MNIKITGSIIGQYSHCPRKGWLFFHGLKTEHMSQNVKIGKYYHEYRESQQSHTEIELEWIKIDQIKGDCVIEYKKANTHVESAKYQLLFYLYTLKQKGVVKTGRIVFKENKNSLLVILHEKSEEALFLRIGEIKKVLNRKLPPKPLMSTKKTPDKKCKWCSYFEFCRI